jgi:photosystem II stability/assembly factor-like uncharacterized protein
MPPPLSPAAPPLPGPGHRSFKDGKTAFACGGSGSLYRSEDAGKSWKRDRSTDDVAGNLYSIKFFNPSLGFVLGNDGILLRYVPKPE